MLDTPNAWVWTPVYIWMLLAGGNSKSNSKRKRVSSENKSRGSWAPCMTHPGSGLFLWVSLVCFLQTQTHSIILKHDSIWRKKRGHSPLVSFRGTPLGFSLCLIGWNWVTCPLPNPSLARGMGWLWLVQTNRLGWNRCCEVNYNRHCSTQTNPCHFFVFNVIFLIFLTYVLLRKFGKYKMYGEENKITHNSTTQPEQC